MPHKTGSCVRRAIGCAEFTKRIVRVNTHANDVPLDRPIKKVRFARFVLKGQ
jgi:hypothetical protein